jgi:N-acetylneuraminic acid mutarotase
VKRLLLVGLFALAGCGGTAAAVTTPAATPASSSTPVASRSLATLPPSLHVTTTTWRLPYPIAREAVMPDPARPGWFVLAGGMFAGDTSSARAIEVNPTTGRIRRLPALTIPVHDVAAGPYAGKPAVFGGGNTSEQSAVQVFNGTAWHVVTHMPTTRSDLSVVVAGGRTLVIGGYDGSGVPRGILAVGPNGLSRFGLLAQGVRYAATAVVGSSVFVFGGEVSGAELSAVQQVSATTGRTRVVAQLPHALGHAVAVVLGGRVLLIGGHTSPDVRTNAMWWFNPTTHRFTRAGRLPVALSDSAVAVVGNSAWLLGGEDPGVTSRVVRVRWGA